MHFVFGLGSGAASSDLRLLNQIEKCQRNRPACSMLFAERLPAGSFRQFLESYSRRESVSLHSVDLRQLQASFSYINSVVPLCMYYTYDTAVKDGLVDCIE